jgi:hypothetical protein
MGAALQQVSQVVARGTALHKNDVVVLSSSEQIISFHLSLSSTGLSPVFKHVEYMFICAGHQREERMVEVEIWDATTTTHLSKLLQIVSPHLQSLTLVMTSYAASSLSSLRFPYLESLTLDRLIPIISAPKLVALHVYIPISGDLSKYTEFVYALYAQAFALNRITVVSQRLMTMLSPRLMLQQAPSTTSSVMKSVGSRDPENFTIVMRLSQHNWNYSTRLLQRLGKRFRIDGKARSQFKVVKLVGIGNETYSEWSEMFHKAVIAATGTAEVYAEYHQLDSRDDLLKG